MKKIFTFLALILVISTSLAGQITIENTTFPAEGDTLYSSLDNDGSDLNLLSAGANLFWDFSSLTPDEDLNLIFDDASEGTASTEFPDADLVAFVVDAGSERYLKVDGSQVAEVGFAGLDPILREVSITTVYQMDYVIQTAPLNYGDVQAASTLLRSQFLFDSLPESIKQSLGGFRADSIRVDIDVARADTVDAWGQVKIPGGTFDVLRNKSTEIRNTSVWAYTGFFGWANVTSTIKDRLPDPSVLEPIELEVYTFLNNDSKEPIAAVTLDTNRTPAQVQFKTVVSTSSRDQWEFSSVKITPNPTYGRAKLYYSGLPEGDYALVIHDILGNELMTIDLELQSNGYVKQDFSGLSKGTYLYSLKSSSGDVITTKRLVIITP